MPYAPRHERNGLCPYTVWRTVVRSSLAIVEHQNFSMYSIASRMPSAWLT